MDSRWLLSELAQCPDTLLWRASWADVDPQNALVHHYFFTTTTVESAHAKIFAWMDQPAHALPENARLIKEKWRMPAHTATTTTHCLPIWRVSWLENHEKHALFLFEPDNHEGIAQRALGWSLRRNETLENFQMLTRLGGLQRYQALFDPDEGRGIFAS